MPISQRIYPPVFKPLFLSLWYTYPDLYGIIANFEILSEDYIPENIPGRESPIKESQ